MSTFIEQCLAGEKTPADFSAFIAERRKNPTGGPICEAIGITQEEYNALRDVDGEKRMSLLKTYIDARRSAVPTEDTGKQEPESTNSRRQPIHIPRRPGPVAPSPRTSREPIMPEENDKGTDTPVQEESSPAPSDDDYEELPDALENNAQDADKVPGRTLFGLPYLTIGIIAVILAVAAVLIFLLLSGGQRQPAQTEPVITEAPSEAPAESSVSVSVNTGSSVDTESVEPEAPVKKRILDSRTAEVIKWATSCTYTRQGVSAELAEPARADLLNYFATSKDLYELTEEVGSDNIDESFCTMNFYQGDTLLVRFSVDETLNVRSYTTSTVEEFIDPTLKHILEDAGIYSLKGEHALNIQASLSTVFPDFEPEKLESTARFFADCGMNDIVVLHSEDMGKELSMYRVDICTKDTVKVNDQLKSAYGKGYVAYIKMTGTLYILQDIEGLFYYDNDGEIATKEFPNGYVTITGKNLDPDFEVLSTFQ